MMHVIVTTIYTIYYLFYNLTIKCGVSFNSSILKLFGNVLHLTTLGHLTRPTQDSYDPKPVIKHVPQFTQVYIYIALLDLYKTNYKTIKPLKNKDIIFRKTLR